MDSTITAALIGFVGAVIGGLVVTTGNYYIQKRLDSDRRSQRIRDKLLGIDLLTDWSKLESENKITIRIPGDNPIELTYDPRHMDEESLKDALNEAISRVDEEEDSGKN